MGKRKAATKPEPKKKNAPLSTIFACLFCNHENSVTVKLDKKAGVGQLSCKVCNQNYQTSINYLSAAVDVYSDWVDACDAVAKDGGEGGERNDYAPARATASGRPHVQKGRGDVEDDDDDIIDDEGYGGKDEGIVDDDEDDY